MTFLSSASHRTQLLKKTVLALAVFGLAFPSASTAQVPTEGASVKSSADSATSRQSPQTALEDGTYLFGQSDIPNQSGSAYALSLIHI